MVESLINLIIEDFLRRNDLHLSGSDSERVEEAIEASHTSEVDSLKGSIKKIDEVVKRLSEDRDVALFNVVKQEIAEAERGRPAKDIDDLVDKLRQKKSDLGEQLGDLDSNQGLVEFKRKHFNSFIRDMGVVYRMTQGYIKLIKVLPKLIKKEVKLKSNVMYYFLGLDRGGGPSHGVLVFNPSGKLKSDSLFFLNEAYGPCLIHSWRMLNRSEDDLLKKNFGFLTKPIKKSLSLFGRAAGLKFSITREDHHLFSKTLRPLLNDRKIDLAPHKSDFYKFRTDPALRDHIRLFLKEYFVVKWYENVAGLYDRAPGLKFKDIKRFL